MPLNTTNPEITVVVVNWNRAALLHECLNSLKGQVYPSGEALTHRVVVVDNGSSDDSAEIAARQFPHTYIIRNSENRGFCAANNQGIAVTATPFIALLNNDAAADPLWLYHLRTAFDGRPEIGMAASKIVTWENPAIIDKVGHLIFPDGQNRGRGTGERDTGQYDVPEEVLWPDGCAAMYRKSMLDQIGGFDEDLFAYADDAELGFRGRIAGWRCLYVPGAVVRHRRGATLGQANPARARLIERNRILLAAKLFPWSLLLLNPFYFLQRALAGVWAAREPTSDLAAFPTFRSKLRLLLAVLQGQWEAFLLLPRFLRKRSAVNQFAVLSMAERRRLILSNRLSLAGAYGVAKRTEVVL